MPKTILSRLFLPADILLNKLSFSKKFTLLGLITLVAVCVALASLYIRINEVISTTQNELEGIAIIQPLTRSIQNIQKHRGLSSAILSGISNLSTMQAKQELATSDEFARLEKKLPAQLRQHAAWKVIAAEWHKIETHGKEWNQTKNHIAHTELVNKMLLFNSIVADDYNITADPSLDSYYLLYTLSNELPRAIECIGQMRSYGIAILASKQINTQQKYDFTALTTLLQQTLIPLKISIDKVVQYNPSLQTVLPKTYQNINDVSQQVIFIVHADILSGRLQTTPTEYFSFTTKIIDSSYEQLYQSLFPAAENLMRTRIQHAKNTLQMTVIVSGILLLIMAYLMVAIHRSTVSNIKTLTRSVQQFGHSDFSSRTHLNTHDELETISDSFNTMADDITALIAERQNSLNILSKITHSVPGLVYQYRQRADGSSCFPFASEGIQEIYRASPDEVREDASRIFALIYPADMDKLIESIQTSAEDLSLWHHEYRVRFNDGTGNFTVKWLLGNAIPEREADGSTLWSGFITDITVRKHMEEQVLQLAFFDTLTELPNRRLLNDRLSQTLAASKRSNTYSALMFLDLDNFKPLNDTYGHQAGDSLLVEAANRLKNCTRAMDTVARFGGDEFVVMLTELGADKTVAQTQAAVIAEKIRAAFSEPYLLTIAHHRQPNSSIEHLCTSSIGVIVFNSSEGSKENIIKWADVAMYQAKEAGRNQIRFHTNT